MNRILIASLLALAPAVASAEIVLKGEAKMGLVFDGEDLRAVAGTRLTAHFFGVTDGGLEYGAVLDLDQFQSRNRHSAFGADRPRGYVYVQGGNHRLGLGTGVDGAAQHTVGTLPKTGF